MRTAQAEPDLPIGYGLLRTEMEFNIDQGVVQSLTPDLLLQAFLARDTEARQEKDKKEHSA